MKRFPLIILIGLFVASCSKNDTVAPEDNIIRPATEAQLNAPIDLPFMPELKPGKSITWNTTYDELLDAVNSEAPMESVTGSDPPYVPSYTNYHGVWFSLSDIAVSFLFNLDKSGSIKFVIINCYNDRITSFIPGDPVKIIPYPNGVYYAQCYVFSNKILVNGTVLYYYYPRTQYWIDHFKLNE